MGLGTANQSALSQLRFVYHIGSLVKLNLPSGPRIVQWICLHQPYCHPEFES